MELSLPLGMSKFDLDDPLMSSDGIFSPGSPGLCCTSASSPGSPFSSAMSTSSSTPTPSRNFKSQYRSQRFAARVRSVVISMFPLSTMCPCTMRSIPSQREGRILGSQVTGTIFGYRESHVHFAVQEDQKSVPNLILEFSIPTSTLVHEMASGIVRITLECEKEPNREKLYQELVWSMFCNGRKTGYAIKRICSEFDRHILTVVQAISNGVGVLPMDGDSNEGELMYMRARYERVIGSRDSEAFYMISPDGHGGPELSIFLIRI